MTLLDATGLTKEYRVSGRGVFRAVDNVSLGVEAARTLAVVGESGAGKSTLGRLILRLIEPDDGTVEFDGTDITALGRRGLRRARRSMQMIFQDPYGCLDPRITIGESIGEPLLVNYRTPKTERDAQAAELLDRVGLGARFRGRFPGELSGGQLQRAAIARALALKPKLIVCDEPVAALDMSIRAQVLNLLQDLQEEFGIAYLFISHDLALVEVIADEVAVMRHGQLVEHRPTVELFADPRELYTRELLAAVPRIGAASSGRGSV